MNTVDRNRLFLQANRALREDQLDDAEKLFEQMLAQEPGAFDAVDGLTQVRRRRELEQEVRQLLNEGDTYFRQEAYEDALRCYKNAINRGGDHDGGRGFINLHGELESRTRLTNRLLDYRRQIDELRQRFAKTQQGQGSTTDRLNDLNGTIDRLIEELRRCPECDKMQGELEALRQDVEQGLDHNETIKNAYAALHHHDYETAIRLAERIPAGTPTYNRAREIKTRAKERLDRIQPKLADAEEARRNKNWKEALDILSDYQKTLFNNPSWRRLWTQIGLERGGQLLDAGRQYIQDKNFKEARQSFDSAIEAFSKVLEVYEQHEDAGKLRREATDLLQIAVYQEEAKQHLTVPDHQLALASLEEAQRIIKQAEERGQTYVHVKAIVDMTRRTITQEKEDYAAQMRDLEQGRYYLEQKELHRAKECFERVLARQHLQEKRETAQQLLAECEKKLQRFEQILTQATAAPTVAEQVEYYRQAYTLFPNGTTAEGPTIQERLEHALVELGYQLLDQNRPTDTDQVLALFNEALQLNRDNEKARQGLRIPDQRTRVAAELGRIADYLQHRPYPAAKDFDDPLQDLHTLQTEVADLPELSTQVQSRINELIAQQQTWKKFETRLYYAQQQFKQGAWQQAIAMLAETLKELGDAAPPAQTDCLQQWRDLAAEVEAVQKRVAGSWDDYLRASSTSPTTEVAAFAEPLQTIVEDIQKIEQAVRNVEGTLPADLAELLQQASRAQKYVKLISDLDPTLQRSPETVAPEDINRAIQQIQVFRDQQGDVHDERLAAIETTLRQRLADKIPPILEQARRSLVQEGADAAEHMLQPLVRLSAAHTEVKKLEDDINRYRGFYERFNAQEQSIEQFFIDNRTKRAINASVEWFNSALEFEEATDGSNWKDPLRELITPFLERREAFTYYGHPDNKDEIFRSVEQIDQQSAENALARKIARIARQWANQLCNDSQVGLISSLALMQDFVQARHIALDGADRNRNDKTERQKFDDRIAELTKKIVDQANQRAEKRLEDAKRALDTGRDSDAEDSIQSIDTDIYAKLSKEEGLAEAFDDSTDRATIQQKTKDWQNEIDAYRMLFTQVDPILNQAQEQFNLRKFDAANELLATLPTDLYRFRVLEERTSELQKRIHAARVYTVTQDLEDLLARARVRLAFAPDKGNLGQIYQELAQFLERRDWLLLKPDDQKRFNDMKVDIDSQQARAVELDWLEEQLKELRDTNNYVEMKGVLDTLIEKTRNQHKKSVFLHERTKIEPQARRQQDLHDALNEGNEELNKGNLAGARQAFQRARNLGEDVTDYMRIISAWGRYNDIEKNWMQQDADAWTHLQEDLSSTAKQIAEDALAAAPHQVTEIASELRENITRLQERIKNTNAEITLRLDAATTNMQKGFFDEATEAVTAVLNPYPAHLRAKTLQQRIEQQRVQQEIDRILNDVKQCLNEARVEEYRGAKEKIEGILQRYPDNIDAKAYQSELDGRIREQEQQRAAAMQAEQDEAARRKRINTALVRARQHADNNEFPAAYATLQEAEDNNIDTNEIENVRNSIKDKEATYIDAVRRSIERKLEQQDFRGALAHCNEQLQRKKELTKYLIESLEEQGEIVVRRWIEHELSHVYRLLHHEDRLFAQRSLTELDNLSKLYQELVGSLLAEQRKYLLKQRLELAKNLHAYYQAQPEASIDGLVQLGGHVEVISQDADAFDRTSNEALEATGLYDEIQDNIRNGKFQRIVQKDAEMRGKVMQEPADSATDLAIVADIAAELRTAITEIEAESKDIDDGNRPEIERRLKGLRTLFDNVTHVKNALEESAQWLNRKEFRRSLHHLESLSPQKIWPVLQPIYKQRKQMLTEIVEAKRRADHHGEWLKAYEMYCKVLEDCPDISDVLHTELESCRKNLTNDILQKVRSAFAAVPPKVKEGRELLEEAEAKHWIAEENNDEISNLWRLLPALEQLATAARLVLDDKTRAKEALDQLSALEQTSAETEQAEDWKRLAQAVIARNEESADVVERQIANVRSAAATQPLIQELRDWSNCKRLVDTLSQSMRAPGAADMSQVAQNVTIVRQNRQRYSHPSFERLDGAVHTLLIEAFQAARNDWDFAQARQLGTLLQPFGLDAELKTAIEELPHEQASLLQQQIERITQALEDYDLDTAKKVLEPAQKLARSADDVGLADLQQQVADLPHKLKDRERLVAKVDADLEQFKVLSQQLQELPNSLPTDIDGRTAQLPGLKSINQIVELLVQIQQSAPTLQRAREAVAQTQQRWQEQIKRYIQEEHFPWALALCEQLLRLEQTTEVQQLKQEATKQRDKLQKEWIETATRLVESWNIQAAQDHIHALRRIGAGNETYAHLEETVRQLERQSPPLQAAMQQGLDLWLAGRFGEASVTFASAADRQPDFHEASCWRDSMRLLTDGIDCVTNEQFDEATNRLRRAQERLLFTDKRYLPSIVKSVEYIAGQRERAIYHVQQLDTIAQSLCELNQRRRKTSDTEEFSEVVLSLKAKTEKFGALSHKVESAPADFQVPRGKAQMDQEDEP